MHDALEVINSDSPGVFVGLLQDLMLVHEHHSGDGYYMLSVVHKG